ncbi:MAG: ATP-binding protein [Sterolibacteriaceae bacterium MAG5]|nr:ATP-binding protein [Candidatus Nitricoxidireducens bremensis]
MLKHNEPSPPWNEQRLSILPIQRLGWRDAAILLFGYIALDWASYIHPLHGLNITPWSPAPALGLVFLIRFGRHAVFPLILAIVLADLWIRDLPAALPVSMGHAVLLSLGYWAIAEILRRRLASIGIFGDRQGLFEWTAIIACGTLLISLAFVSMLVAGTLIPAGAWYEALVRYWVGDSVGVLITMPILWMLFDERGRAQLGMMLRTWEVAGYVLGASAALGLSFGLSNAAHSSFFYVLFLPVAWAAARQGLAGAVLSAAIVQVGIIGSVELLGFPAVTILEIQILAVVLVLFGFFIGIVVDEKQRVSAELRQTLRLAAAGEMAGALAHELNQPLTALTTYGAACERLLKQGDSGARLYDTVSRMVAESHRAADVLRRLRDFFRTGATRLEPVELGELLAGAVKPFAGKLEKLAVELTVDAGRPCTLLADRLQLEVVLRNLLSNAIDAVSDRPPGQRRIRVAARPAGVGRVRLSIEDTGIGLSAVSATQSFEPFRSSKSTGLGLGLAISRAIVEAHGGSLWAEVADHGLFQLELPTEGMIEDVA